MEKKTIGGLIAALRRANGMTQKELAEKLNVSDKTVSRWECDDGLPELSLVPVIAEVFGITCDELLSGTRRSPQQREQDAVGSEQLQEKSDKQRVRILKKSTSQYKLLSWIAAGVSIVGFVIAVIINFGFLNAVLAFGAAMILFVAAVIVQAAAVNRAFLAVDDAQLPDEMLYPYNRNVVKTAEFSFGLTAILFASVCPLLFVLGSNFQSSSGLNADSFLLCGGIAAAAVLIPVFFICRRCNASCIEKGLWKLEEKEEAKYRHNTRLQNIVCGSLAGVLLVTALLHVLLAQPAALKEGTVFNDYESFVEFMERDEKCDRNGNLIPKTTENSPVPSEKAENDTAIWYDENGNEITEEQALTRQLTDIDGNVVCTYLERNENYSGMTYTPKKGTVLPITVYTRQDWQKAREKAAQFHVIFAVIYIAQVSTAAVVYQKKRKV